MKRIGKGIASGASLFLLLAAVAAGADSSANGLTYLDDPIDPYYVSLDFPRLETPQWVGDPDVTAVVILAIDDMRAPDRYEAYLRPILDRLAQHQGRASLSIMTNQVDPANARLEGWIREGVNIDVHTIDHPCPLLCDSDLGKAKSTYDRCVNLMNEIDGNRATAFRMPCCDSMNSPSPRFFETIFNQTTDQGHFLTIDSSVFSIITDNDPSLPDSWVKDEAGRDRFRKYVGFSSFVNTIEDYPFPYLIGRLCWEFPCVVPSDWEAQHLHQPNNPQTVTDLKTALDVIVRKRGVMNLVFHPHGWIRNDQIVQLIDHAADKYGSRVRFMNFREAQQRIDKNMLGGAAVRGPDGSDQGVRLLDVDRDGLIDVVRHDNNGQLHTRVWQQETRRWIDSAQPLPAHSLHFGIFGSADRVGCFVTAPDGLQWWLYNENVWRRQPLTISMDDLDDAWQARLKEPDALDAVRCRDLDGDGTCEVLLSRGADCLILRRSGDTWSPLTFSLPTGVRLAARNGADSGLRWIDLDKDGVDECVYSDPERFSIHRLTSIREGWQTLNAGKRDALHADHVRIPPFVRPDGSNNGVWSHSNALWWQNEDTARLPDKVDRLIWDDVALPALDSTESSSTESSSTESSSDVSSTAAFPGPLNVDAALESFRSSVDARVERVATEPLIADPIAFDWAPDGRLFVVEMGDYPSDLGETNPPRGRVRVLFDDDDDGRYDRSETFLDGLHFPTGVKVWRDGVLVTVAPNIIFATDTDGDNRADQTRVLYRGFTEGNQQHRINGLRWGIDNWLYLANGDSGGTIESFSGPQSVSLSGRDLRIQPDDGRFQAISGQSQFGRCRDDLGNWFGGDNSDPLWHFVLDERYLNRNPHFAPRFVHQQVPQVPGPAPVFPSSPTLLRFNDYDRVDRFTSACGPLLMTDSGFGPRGTIDSFVCEPVHNLVHRERVTADGVSFRSARLPEDREAEFLASTDNWFRPVHLRIGPNGALWIADMYRLVIEHPEWIPRRWQQQLDLRAGHDRGRIYRVWPKDRDRIAAFPRLDQATTLELVQRLDHPNRWQRDTAQQMLLWKNDPSAIEPLRSVVVTAHQPVSRIQALYLLQAMDAIEPGWLSDVIRNSNPPVARHAIVIAESHWNSEPAVLDSALTRVKTDDRPLQQQLAYSLGSTQDPRAAAALADLATREPVDPVIQASVLSSLTSFNVGQVLATLEEREVGSRHSSLLFDVLNQCLAMGDEGARAALFQCVLRREHEATWRMTTLATLLSKLSNRAAGLTSLPESVRAAVWNEVQRAGQIAREPGGDLATRLAAILLLRSDVDPLAANFNHLHTLLDPQEPPDVQAAAGAQLLDGFPDQAIAAILAKWNHFSPGTRTQLLDRIFRRNELVAEFLESARRNRMTLQLDARRRQRLLDTSNDRVRRAAKAMLSDHFSSSRAALIGSYLPADGVDGDVASGKKTFDRVCTTCHTFAGTGHAVGPNLDALGNKSVEFLLTSILDPNRAVESIYRDYYVETIDGRQFTGILQAETANSITLLSADAKQHRVLRSEIEDLHTKGKSLMPEGLEKDISPPQMFDLLAYLRTYQPSRKRFPGNGPRIAPRRDDGSTRLLAMHAEIYGPSLRFEGQNRILSAWSSPGDYAVWSVKTPEEGNYAVRIKYACAPESAGNRFSISCGDERITWTVASTGGWDTYHWKSIGRLRLPSGSSRIWMCVEGALSRRLLDLHQIILSPEDD